MGDRHVRGASVEDSDGLPGSPLLSQLGHELRSPLTGILGLTRIMLLKLSTGPADSTQQIRQLELVRASAELMLGTVDRVVELTKLANAATQPDPEPSDCRARIADVVARARPAADALGRQLILDLPDDPVVIVDRLDAVARILTELIDNAVKYTDHTDIRINLRARPDRQPALEVSDDGPGMADDEQARVGSPFQRGAAAEHNETPGSGLGLYLARQLADRAGFQLLLKSTPAAGTTFTVLFGPAAEDRRSEQKPW